MTADGILAVGRPRLHTWQPIETCPWGDRDVLLRFANGKADVWPAYLNRYANGKADARPVAYDRPTVAMTPTHWADLPAPPGHDAASALAVVLDYAEEHGEYPLELRERIAGLLERLKIATPWVVSAKDGGRVARWDTGGSGMLSEMVLTRAPITAWLGTLSSREDDERLRARGWVLAPQPRARDGNQ